MPRPITCKNCNNKFFEKDKINEKETKDVFEQKKRLIDIICPKCLTRFCTKDDTERNLFLLQEKFYESGKEIKYLNEMTKILNAYAESFIKKYYIRTIDPFKMQYYANNATSQLIESYYLKKNTYVYASFGGILNICIKMAIYGKQEYTSKYSLDFEFNDGNFAIHGDKKYDYIGKVEEINHIKYLQNIIETFLFETAGKEADTPFDDYKRLLCLNFFIKRGEDPVDYVFRVWGKNGKFLYNRTITGLKKLILEIIEKGE